MSSSKNTPTGASPSHHFEAVLNGIDDVIYVADPHTYELLFVNDAARAFWGDNIVGQKCHKVLQNLDAPCPFCSNPMIFGENLGKTHVWEFQNLLTRQWYRCADKAIQWTDGRMVRFELANDISSLKATEQNLTERVRELDCMQRVSSAIEMEGSTVDNVFQ
ncbi:PAS domain-containing protein, partial [Myxococcota bacterium]|nr:PAS domain-containing protein [Myxococcota bacterium]